MELEHYLKTEAVALATKVAARDALLQKLQDTETEILQLQERKTALAAVGSKVTDIAVACQQECQHSISALVTRCLEAVFPENRYRFALVFEQKREQTEARCVLNDAAGNEYDPLTACGGGVVDVISFALRLATLILSVPQPSKVLILDEPFRFLSAGHRPRLVNLLESLCQETGFQIIMVTHFPEFSKGNVIEL
jgi:DNA repair exonuclease SbcCD ATPase subunit